MLDGKRAFGEWRVGVWGGKSGKDSYCEKNGTVSFVGVMLEFAL